MTLNELSALLDDCCNDFSFVVDGKTSGIIPEVKDYERTYCVWYGNDMKILHNLSDVLDSPFFGGKSLKELCEKLDFQIS